MTEWLAYDLLDPIGGERGDLQAGMVAAAVSNPWRGKGEKYLTPADFMPDFGGLRAAAQREKKAQAMADLAQQWKALAQKSGE